jgi:hypothetical protein
LRSGAQPRARDVVAPLDHFRVVGGERDDRATPGDAGEQGADPLPAVGVQLGRRLVGEQHLRGRAVPSKLGSGTSS